MKNKDNPKVFALDTKVDFENQEGETPEVTFEGYSGAPVDLRDYGFDYEVVYDMGTMEIPNQIPILYKHYDEIGHTDSVENKNGRMVGKGKLSVPGPSNSKVKGGLKNGFPYQGSMGLSVPDLRNSVKFYKKGESFTVNNRALQGPMYVVENSVLREMTVTPFGRDSDTSFKALNEDDLMKIKNEAPAEETLQKETGESNPVQVDNSTSDQKGTTETNPVQVDNSTSESNHELPSQVTLLIRTQKLLNRYPEHAELIENGLQQGWDNDYLEAQIQIKNYEAQLPKPPSSQKQGADEGRNKLFEARVMNSFGVSLDRIQKDFGEKIANQVADSVEMTITEQLVYCARLDNQSFTGINDVEDMCTHFRNSGFSTLDLPNLLHRTSRVMMDERWELNPPFAVNNLREESNRDFRKVERRRITGGEMWGALEDGGKLKHYAPGKDDYYTTELDTVGRIFAITREDLINDDMDALRDMLDAMIEGALMVPDVMLGKLMLKDPAAGTFWVDDTNSYDSTALTRANLSTLYNAARQYDEKRGSINWNTVINGRWKLITSVGLEETAWDIIKQDRVYPAGGTNLSRTGEKNYWFNRFDLVTFPQMSNPIMGSGTFVSENTYLLWPSDRKFSPYTITYLRGRKRPTVEAVSLPMDMLGRGLRGYWDVNVNERYNTAIVRANG